MNETDKKDFPENEADGNETEIVLEGFRLNPLSSAEVVRSGEAGTPSSETASPQALAESGTSAEQAAADPVFAELAAPQLPELRRENRARLQMQSPHRMYFYWGLKNNPYQILQRMFGGSPGSYQLVARLVNQTRDREEMYAVEPEGNWWFNVEPDSTYRAEIGLYAPNRPYIRLLFSNTVTTPRKSPSPRSATDADWAVSTTTFARVLDAAGFKQDAFEVALAGDDAEQAETATENALWQLIGRRESHFIFDPEEVRLAILALASGIPLEALRGQISEALFIFLQEHAAKLSIEQAMSVLRENFDVFDEEVLEEEEIGARVYGASLVNFPRSVRTRRVPKTRLTEAAPGLLPKLAPVSSFR